MELPEDVRARLGNLPISQLRSELDYEGLMHAELSFAERRFPDVEDPSQYKMAGMYINGITDRTLKERPGILSRGVGTYSSEDRAVRFKGREVADILRHSGLGEMLHQARVAWHSRRFRRAMGP